MNYLKPLLSLLFFVCFIPSVAFAQTQVTSNITSNTTWTRANSPYLVTNNVLVATGITLTVEPGVQVKFGENIGLVVNGKIVAVGTTSSRILFTSNKETPQKGDWASIKLTSSATGSTWDTNFNFLSGSKFENCDFSYAGNSAIISEVPLFIEKSLFSKNKNWGEYRKGVFQQGNQYYYAGGALSLKGGVSVIKSTLFFDNESDNGYSHGFGGAIYSQSGGNIIGCVFINNTAIGMEIVVKLY